MTNSYLKKKLLLLLVCVNIFVFGQSKDNVNLPEAKGKELSFYGTIDLFVTKNQEVFNENKIFVRYDDISNFILSKHDLPLPERRVLVYADRKTRYSFIDKLKQEIALVEKSLFLMTDSSDDTKRGYSIFLNSFLLKHKNNKTILTLEQEIKNEEFNKNVPPPPLPPLSLWHRSFAETIYSGEKGAIIKALTDYSYDVFRVLPNKRLEHNNSIISGKSIDKIIGSKDVIFLKFDKKILYEDYIYAIQEIKNSQRNLKEKNGGGPYLVEISFQIEHYLKNLNILF